MDMVDLAISIKFRLDFCKILADVFSIFEE